MTSRSICFLFAFIPTLAFSQTSLRAMDDADLAEIIGREGIAADLELRVNADTDGNPLQSLNYCQDPGGGGADLCRMSFLFHNRESGGGEWVTWKNFFGVLKVNNLWIDADQSPGTASPYPDDSLTNRFMSGSATPTCLLDGAKTAATCYEATQNLPMLALRFNEGNAAGIELFLNLGGVAIEYGAQGYLQNDRGPALGVMIGDVRGTDLANPVARPAEIRIGGKMGLYGF